jgi:hypothetical protein
MAENTEHVLDAAPIWWVSPEQTDWLAWSSAVTIALAIYLVVWLYAKFDKWAEHRSKGTPLAKTIPTLLTIALLYEIFPLDHFHVLLPLTAIMLAVMADWMHARSRETEPEPAAVVVVPETAAPEPTLADEAGGTGEPGEPEART